MTTLEHAFQRTIRRFRMLEGVRSVGVACSGGPDSTALFHLLHHHCSSKGIRLVILHVHHGLRGRSADRDESFVRNLAANRKLQFVSARVDVKREAKRARFSIEEAARELRYRFLIDSARRHRLDTIALGHTQDDHAETVLMRVLFGSGLQGLGGSRACFNREGIQFFRPLIEISKDEILQFLRERKFSFRVDQSNYSGRFVRNRIRSKLIPFLEQNFHPGIRKVLARLPETIWPDLDLIEGQAAASYKQLAVEKGRAISFPAVKFRKLKEAIQFRLLQRASKEFGPNEFMFDHWVSFREQFARKEAFQVSFPGGLLCLVSHGRISIQNEPAKKVRKGPGYSYRLRLGNQVHIPEFHVWIGARQLKSKPRIIQKKREDYAIADLGEVGFPLEIRSRRSGDLFQPLGQKVPSKLKDFFIHKKVPRERRDAWPLVFSGKELVWVSGLAVSENAKITDKTHRFVKLSVQ